MLVRSRSAAKILCMVLAGGEGRRLYPLTIDRAKPAVSFAGRYRIIDVVLSNLVNSGLLKIKVVTQYKSHSLETHVARAWRVASILDQFIEAIPAQQRTGKSWFKGSADAVYQCFNVIRDEHPTHVLVFGGDHIYKMDVRQMLDFHFDHGAELTVAAIPVPLASASAFGVVETDTEGRAIGFQEKPNDPRPIPGRPSSALVSMGNYVFETQVLIDALEADAADEESNHDFGADILPRMVGRGKTWVYDFATNEVPGESERERGYWRDIGTIESYFAAQMDLVSIHPLFNLYNALWPMRTINLHEPPAKFVFSDEAASRIGIATDSLVCDGCIVSGGRIHRTVMAPRTRINSYSHIEECILLEGVNVGRHARIRRAIVDKDVEIPAGTEIGYDLEADRQRFFVSEGGIVVVPKGTTIK